MYDANEIIWWTTSKTQVGCSWFTNKEIVMIERRRYLVIGCLIGASALVSAHALVDCRYLHVRDGVATSSVCYGKFPRVTREWIYKTPLVEVTTTDWGFFRTAVSKPFKF